MMGEMERTRVMKELTRLLQNSTGEVESESELDVRVEAIKRELGAWFIGGVSTLSSFIVRRCR